MRRMISILLLLLFMLNYVTVFAAEEDLTFGISDLEKTESMTLMSGDNSFEELILGLWDNFSIEYVDISQYNMDAQALVSAYAKVFYENPQYFYVQKSLKASGYDEESGYFRMLRAKYVCSDKEGIPTKEEIEAYKPIMEKINDETEEILLYISPDMTDFEKIAAVHDYMVLNYVYDTDYSAQNISIIYNKRGICTSYVMAFIHLMNKLGIKCTYVNSSEMGHLWNLVKLDGEWYHIDLTYDDPVDDRYAMVSHEYFLMSTDELKKKKTHYGFDLGDYTVDSTLYDNAVWKTNSASITYADGKSYWVEGNDLLDEDGNIIAEDLDGGDGKWNLTKKSSIPNVVFAGVCEVNGKLYYNTDSAVYSYDPKTKKTVKLHDEYGICGLFADKNILRYSKYSGEAFTMGGSIKVADCKYNEAGYEDSAMTQRVYNDTEGDIWVISKGAENIIKKVKPGEIYKAAFENTDVQKIFIWTDKLEPLK